MNKPATTWQLVPAAPTQDWTNAFAARGPRIGTFDTTIRDVLATAPAPGVDVLQDLLAVHASLAFLPPADAAIAALERIIGMLSAEAKHSPAAQGDQHDDQRREAVMEAIAAALGEAYDCTRTWSAWSHGTMGPDDFALVAEDSDRLAELADAAIAAMCAAPAAGDAPATVSLVTRQGPGQQLFTYTSQPCDNVIAWRIGEACTKASLASAGDYIDRGLVLLKALQAKGYGIAAIAAPQDNGGAA
ncbi:MAG: hypothetical protein ACN6PJ_15685 [Achromobacter sp.]|uniref:hypothetical protein n=1 Tax=Achromobacter sp. TaxID=134375 RepID=UPI003D04E9D4